METMVRVFRVDAEEAQRIDHSTNEPHQHDVEELIIGAEGMPEHVIDFQSATIQAPFVSFVTNGKVHRVRPGSLTVKCDLWVVRFRSEFIPETTFQLHAYYHDNANILSYTTRTASAKQLTTLKHR